MSHLHLDRFPLILLRTSLVVVTCLAATGCGHAPPAAQRPMADQWIRTELFFGLSRPGGAPVTEAEWTDFLDQSVTPRFPNGLTVVQANGRYRSQHEQIKEEPAGIVIILHPSDQFPTADQMIQQIAAEYIRRFEQESVLRCDSVADAVFISAQGGEVKQAPANTATVRKLSKSL